MKYTIIGAGIGGLTTGLAFEKAGIEYQIFERFKDLKEVGAGIWLSPNALQVLEYLDLLEEVKLNGNSIDRITIGRPDLTPISDNPQDFIKGRFGYSAIAIHRAKLQKILLDRIPKDKIYFDKSFESFETLKNGEVKVLFADGSEAHTDFLIGADGIHSRLRKQLFPDSQLRYTGQTCWRGIANTELHSDFDHRVYELWGKQVRFGFSRISKAKYYWFAVALDEPNQTDDSSCLQQKLLSLFDTFHSTVIDLIKATAQEDVIRNDINDLKPMPHWYRGNVCLIGDAGHATTPNMGQGGAQAIEDAYYLSHIIQASPNKNNFESFQAKRQAKVNSIVSQSWTTGKIAHWRYGRGLRNMILKIIPKTLLNKKMIEMYQIEQYNS